MEKIKESTRSGEFFEQSTTTTEKKVRKKKIDKLRMLSESDIFLAFVRRNRIASCPLPKAIRISRKVACFAILKT